MTLFLLRRLRGLKLSCVLLRLVILRRLIKSDLYISRNFSILFDSLLLPLHLPLYPQLRPRCLLFGRHHSAISLCFIKNWSGERDRIGSLSEKGSVHSVHLSNYIVLH